MMKLIQLGIYFGVITVSLCHKRWKLIFEDNFDKLDITKWDHEVTMWGGGVSKKQHILLFHKSLYVT